jgi:hypothetical protein
MCAPSHSYPKRIARAPYHIVICGLYGSILSFHSALKNGTIFEKKERDTEHIIVFEFSLQVSSETFLILRKMQRDTIVNVGMSSWKVLITVVLMKHEFYL